MGFHVKGIEELMSALSEMAGPNFADGALREGLRLGGKLVQGTAKQLCPVGDPAYDPNSGQLRNSIEMTDISNGVDIGTNVGHAEPVEFGTGALGDPSVAHTTKEKWAYYGPNGFRTGKPHPPQPFLYPALKANEANIEMLVKNTLQAKINKAVKG